MRPGVSSFAFGWAAARATPPLDERDLLAFARQHGVGVVQLGDNVPVHEMDAPRRAALAAEAARLGITIELGARGLTDTHLELYLGLCTQCRASLLRFVADRGDYRPSTEDLRALLCNALPALEGTAVTLALENHDRLPARVLRDLVDRVGNDRVGICLDTANSLGAGEGLEHVVDLLAPVAVNLHVKDVAIVRLPHQMGFVVEGRPLGEGQLPLRATVARVADAGRCHSAILEGWTSPAGDLIETLAAERAAAAQGIQTLKRWIP